MGLTEPPPLGASLLPSGAYDGQVVIVTGGGTGLGLGIAVEFARLGAAVAIVSRSEEHRAAGVSAIEQVGARGFSTQCDIRQPDQIAEAFGAIESEFGLADVLVNNASANFPVPAEDMSPNAWRAVTDIVLNGTYFCSREFARRHIVAGRPGSIINIGASHAWTGGPGASHNAAAKAGVKNMTESLAVEWAPYGIRVNGLVPGLFPHGDEVEAIRGVPGRGRNEGGRQPAGRVGQPRELGWSATFLASPFAAYISGHTLVVDGANWQRRYLLMPEFTPIRDQLERGPFDPERKRTPQ